MQLARGEIEQAEREKTAQDGQSSCSEEGPKELSFKRPEDDESNRPVCDIDDEIYDKEFTGKDKLK